MAQFLRDERLQNLTITEDSLNELQRVFVAQSLTIPDPPVVETPKPLPFVLSYIIRFDSKGYQIFSFQELLQYFRQAKEVERVLFTLESDISLRTKRAVGSVMELRLDRGDPNLCIVSVTSDNSPWVDASFRAAEEVLSESKNRNAWVRNNWTALVIQFLGVVIGFFFSLWGGTKIAPYLSIENDFLISFFLALLLFSNLWVYLNQLLHVWLNREFPNIKFYRPDRDKKHWLTRSIIVTIVGAIIVYVASWVFLYVGRIVGSFISQTP
jgi:hypothetical protein